MLNVEKAFAGTRFFTRLTAEEQHEIEVKVSAGRLSQFLHGEQGALLVCGQLVNSIPELDAKLYASTQVVDEGRHAAPQVPRRRDPVAGDPTLAQVLDYVLTDEGRHVNFGYFALRRAIPEMEPGRRQQLEDFALRACDAMYARDDETGSRSIRTVWAEMGWDGEKIWHDTVTNSESPRTVNRPLFTEVLIPRLRRLNVISPRVERRYREIGLLGSGLSP